MIKLAILSTIGDLYFQKFAKPLLEDIVKAGFDCEIVNRNNAQNLVRYNAVYMLTHGVKFDYNGLSKKVPIINSYRSQEIAMNKIESNMLFKSLNIPHPEFSIANTLEDIIEFTRINGTSILKYPYDCGGHKHFILKHKKIGLMAHNGEGIHIINEHKGYLEIGDNIIASPYLIQKYVSFNQNKANDRVYRIYVVGNETPFGTLRIKEGITYLGDSLINIAQGAHYEFLGEIRPEMQEIALRVADAVGFEIGVVDILEDNNERAYVIECDCDGRYAVIDRKFMHLSDYSNKYNFNQMIGKRLSQIASGDKFRK